MVVKYFYRWQCFLLLVGPLIMVGGGTWGLSMGFSGVFKHLPKNSNAILFCLKRVWDGIY
jgi:hypothetical protein